MLAYLVRHAESLTNAQAGAGLNPSLSPLGIRQAESLRNRFRGIKITALYCSPFTRCIETISSIAEEKQLPIRLRPDLHEWYNAVPEARIDTELATPEQVLGARRNVVLCEDWRGPVAWPPVAESGTDLFARMQGFANYLKERWSGTGSAALVVSHGSPLAKLVDAWLSDVPGPGYRYLIDNCGLSALRFVDGLSSLVCLNEMSHLVGLPAPEIANYHATGSIKVQKPPFR